MSHLPPPDTAAMAEAWVRPSHAGAFNRLPTRGANGCSLGWAVAAVMMLAGCTDHLGQSAQPSQGGARSGVELTPTNPDFTAGAAGVRSSKGPTGRPQSSRLAVVPQFNDVARESGIDLTYFTDAVPNRYFLPEIMGGGAAWFDFDGDGMLDLYLLNGCELKDPDPAQTDHVHHLYRQAGKGSFTDVTAAAGAAHNGYGQGCAVADFDADGFPDLYVTCYGPNVLYHNNGDGTFSDITAATGTGDPLWGTGAVWFDFDDDGDLDLYLANYMEVTWETHKQCSFGGRAGYCGPGEYESQPDRLFVSQGDGSFVEQSEQHGFVGERGNGLAVAWADFDEDRLPELYVANDMAPNYLFSRTAPEGINKQRNTLYTNVAPAAGCAVGGNGQNEASMGIALADFDRDGALDIYLTHYYHHKNTLYRNLGHLLFEDDSYRTRVAAHSAERLGFGTVPLDFDRDGAMDLFVANGHVLGPLHEPSAMQPQLLHNDGQGRFDDASAPSGTYFAGHWLGRGVAAGDFDNDGDLDIVVTHLDRPVALLRNDTPVNRRWVGVELRPRSRIPAVGGWVTLVAGSSRQKRHITAGGSYYSWSDERILFGLGDRSGPVTIEVTWPNGVVESTPELALDRYWVISEGLPPFPTDQ